MAEPSVEGELREALTALETHLTTPIISGELAVWVEQVQSSCEEASAQIQRSIGHAHPRQYESMAEMDDESFPRIEQLRAEDEAIEQQRRHIDQAVTRAAEHVPKLEPDEEKAQKHVQKLVDDGIVFITRVRKHEVAVETWFVEEFNRDRGSVD